MASSWLSERSVPALAPPLSYWPGFQQAMQGGLWTPDNPEGYISMVVAENRLSSDLIREGLLQHAADWPPSMLHYQDARGIPELRASLSRMVQRTFMKGVDVDPEHLTVLTGAGSVIDLLLHCVADAGDAVLIPAPYYPAFDNDLKVRNNVHPVPAYLDCTQQDLSAGLDAAAADARQQGRRVAAVLFTNPTNPQGMVLSREQTRSIISWCLKNRLHCIGDEVYALSVFDPSVQLVSTSQVLAQDAHLLESPELAGDLVHTVFGASKDFCGSGLRVGVLYSKNAALNTALGNLGYFASVPAPLQMSLSKLLADDTWLDGYLKANRARMLEAYKQLAGALDAAGIPYTPSPAGMFTWLDLRAAFSSNGSSAARPAAAVAAASSSSGTWQDEADLWQHMLDVHKLVLTPGAACHAAEPGFFRMCWAWPHPGSHPTAVQRLQAAMQQFQQRDVQQAADLVKKLQVQL